MTAAALPFLLLLLGGRVVAVCPTVCTCSRGHRVVDCSSRGLTKLPPGLQHNINFVNLSFNSLQALESQLSHYAHLRTLDLSYNRLEALPPALPRSLWHIRASGNHLRSLDKNDTAYHWNLRVLDLSDNELERVVFINNTLPGLRALDLSYNRFWTVPTNMPHHLESVDLSHNYLVQILPGSLDRLPRLARFYLHANRFSWLPEGAFEKLAALEALTLGDNPWACEEEENISKLLAWAGRARATVSGCPCYTKPVCGRQAPPGRERPSAAPSTEPPLWADWALYETEDQDRRGANESGDREAFGWAPPTEPESFSTHESTTARRPAAGRPRAAAASNTQTVPLILVLTAFNTF
ncbi:oligodendrocyte-myelin glycoprotein isoform X2 [Pseudoliparis swirei]|nr:oligodendrocyte-myelin glycoprotein isoform X2 [Pseudoliparis swirei]XP_056296850.1 oligodendrocyte-myelin glycoprotein isoform X2 [Pseudoliparis swirei]